MMNMEKIYSKSLSSKIKISSIVEVASLPKEALVELELVHTVKISKDVMECLSH